MSMLQKLRNGRPGVAVRGSAVAVTAGLLVGMFGAPAALAALPEDPATITIAAKAPAGTTQLWVDLEGAAASDTISTEIQSGAAATRAVKWASTAYGRGFRDAQLPGAIKVKVTASKQALQPKPELALTFADANGVVLAESRHELVEAAGPGGTPGGNPSVNPGGNQGGTPNVSGNPGSLTRTGSDLSIIPMIVAALLLLSGAAAVGVRSVQRRRAAAGVSASIQETDVKEPQA